MHLTWLDSNSWLIEMGGKRILLDPWLVGTLSFGNLDWLFQGTRAQDRDIPPDIDLILLSQGLADHAHPQTLARLDHAIPVVGSVSAAKVAKDLGYTQVTALAHQESVTRDALQIRAFPGSPIGPTLTENAYLLTDRQSGITLYYEPHGYHSPLLKSYAPIDVVITPLMDLTLPLVGAIIKGNQSALELAQWVQPQVIMSTAAGGAIQFSGVLLSLLKAVGSAAEFRSLLAQHHLTTQVIDPQPGERFALQLRQPVVEQTVVEQ
jgi:L-ascorbate metabolism protein UlaG (beta-lactamase superfamily)